MGRKPGSPEWWDWELELSPHLMRRMIKRHFNETDLRTMLSQAIGFSRDVDPDRWVISARWQGNRWEVIVEPDSASRRLVVVTAYAVE